MVSDVVFVFGFQELHSVIHRHISIRHMPCITLRKTTLKKIHVFRGSKICS